MARLLMIVAPLCLTAGNACTPSAPQDHHAAPSWESGGDGYLDPPGQGACYFIDRFALNQTGAEIDLTGDGEPDATLNHAFARELEYFNLQLNNLIESGRYLSMIEVAGLGLPYAGEDDAVTLKFYPCHDADADIANNACLEPGCGHMLADPDFMIDGQSLYRTAPAPLRDHRVLGQLSATLYIKISDHALPIRRTTFDLRLPADLGVITDSLMCGAATAHGLDLIPLCHLFPDPCPPFIPPDMTMAVTLAERGYQPDVDLDGDGLETFDTDPATYEVVSCRDGDGAVIAGAGCLHDGRVADGYSVCFDQHAVPGQLDYSP